MGVHRLRLTGGEPLVRADLPRLVEMLAAVPGIDDLALTTNGILLDEQAADLRRAGLERLNISLDTLNEETFQKISRREGLDRVLAGIAAAQDVGFERSGSTPSPSTASPKTKSSRSPASPASAASSCGSSNTCRSTPSTIGSRPTCSTAKQSAASSKPNSAR